MAPSMSKQKGPQPKLSPLETDGEASAVITYSRPPSAGTTLRPQSAVKGEVLPDRTRPNTSTSRPEGRPQLSRAKTDVGPRREDVKQDAEEEVKQNGDDEWKIRHGFENQLLSEEYNNLLNSTFYMYFTENTHETGGRPKDEKDQYPLQEWRMRDRLKTVSAVLALCLNIGVDPPDVIKTSPCAKVECWIEPNATSTQSGQNMINQIGKALQGQYEQLSMRTRYKQCLDPTVEETRRYCSTLRKNARNERVLFHYNGHGVPRPTPSGEIWVFNKNYTQYIPISLYDLQNWLTAPSLFVYDCSDAGLIIQNFNKFAEKHQQEYLEARRTNPQAEVPDFSDCIHLAACAEKESLPTNPNLPADVFTSCLTTPIEMAVRFFILQNPLPSNITLNEASNIPGRVSERRTPIGELNWIFTAITDTIAWNSLSKPLFKKLFRQDLMVAALFRNFLLAQRVMRVYHCTPQCYPVIPQTYNHPLWKSWDLAVEMILAQLPDLLAAERGDKPYEYQHSDFFAEQLTAFEVYLSQSAAEQKAPEQLPIVLQVLLSQVHRLRALILLSRFLDLGPWAVNLALSIGIFPYVLKLLQSQAIELKPVMVFIWARILAVDQSCQSDLLKDNGYQYFINILHPSTNIPIGNASEHRAMCAFIVAMFCRDFKQGKHVALSQDLIESCLANLDDQLNPLLRQWSCLCISLLWHDFPEAKWLGIRCGAHQRLCDLVLDPVPEVRTAMLHSLTSFLGIPDLTAQVAQVEESIASMVLIMTTDGNTMVRKELLVFFSTFIERHRNKFTVAAYEQLVEEQESLYTQDDQYDGVNEKGKGRSSLPTRDSQRDFLSHNTVFAAIWKEILIMSVDPHPEIAENASGVVDFVFAGLLGSPLASMALPMLDEVFRNNRLRSSTRQSSLDSLPNHNQLSHLSQPPTPTKQDGYLSAGFKRTASVAASLKNLAFGTSTPSTPQDASQALKTPSKSAHPDRLPGQRSTVPNEWNRPLDDRDQHSMSGSYQPTRTPLPRGFKRSNSLAIPKMPLKSRFFEWSTEYFREPQMKPQEAEEPGSTDYNERLWRRNRNDRIIAKTQPQKEIAGSNKWDKPRGFFNNGSQPMKMVFHQFENHLIVTDDRDIVSVWDWKHQSRLHRFSAGNPPGSRITEVKFINEDDQALLMTGSSDGVIKLFRDYETPPRASLVTTFRALTDLVPSNRNAGLVFDWQQGRGTILVAGDVKVIRVWNAGTEICTADISARSGSCITSLTSEQVEGHLFVAGFGDGAIRLYDQRLKPMQAMVRVWKEHRQWLTNIHLQRGGQRELVSGCRSGEVKLWDIRHPASVATIDTSSSISNATNTFSNPPPIHSTTNPHHTTNPSNSTLRTLSVHEHAPVFATGSNKRTVKVWNTNGTFLSSFEPWSGFLRSLTPVAASAFHPHRLMVAGAAVGDGHVNVFGVRDGKGRGGEEV
ncbi:WD-repeat protein mip1 [Patellaria atrata CBS 101060]|uniref:WD-repeat protein mip1 n=1 Tax=Patellaria atrata CBS 101060 TaxID=1346257 RepID=A0A9P4SAJ8_9PEZI|nr:WD-repeat protein mip1 [Patellaria atrata CBS 101060]